MIIKNIGRLSFPDIFVARPFEAGQEPKFKATFLMEKGSKEAKAVEAAIREVAVAKWKDKADQVLATIRNNPNKFCFQDGDNKTYDGYAGSMALSANNIAKPRVEGKDGSLIEEASGIIYSGCYVIFSVEVFAYTNKGNGISAKLRAVRFYKDGDAFVGSAPAGDNEFDDIDLAVTEADDLIS